MSDSEEEDLKRAIALSLGQNVTDSVSQTEPAIYIDITSDEENEDDLDAPLITNSGRSANVLVEPESDAGVTSMPSEISPREHAFQGSLSQKSSTSRNSIGLSQGNSNKYSSLLPDFPKDATRPQISQSTPNPNSQTGLSGLNRKQMEEERLLRASQRTTHQISLRGPQESQKRKRSPQSPEHLNRQHVKPKPSISTPPQTLPNVASFKDQQNLRSTGIQFPHGVVKKTWVYGYPRENDIKIEEVLQKGDLELAVLSAFQVEPEWVISKLDPSTKVVWILQAKTEWERKNFESEAPSNYKFCFPSMEGQINCMHSKLQLLSHPTHLRVVVPSANLVPYDWGETGVMENMVFLIDLPRLPNEKTVVLDDLTDFGKELHYFLDAMGLDKKISNSLLKFDFSHTARLRFVHSIGGTHAGEKWSRTGYCGLGRAVRSLGLQTNGSISIDLVSASIGNLNDSFLKAIYLAAQGDSGITEYDWRTKKMAANTALVAKQQMTSNLLKERFRVYFPTRDTVAQSRGGVGAGGTICFQPQWYNSASFPKHVMRDCKSQRPGLLMHNKMLFVRPDDAALSAWSYVGSANLSESAWGRLVKDRTTKEPKLNIRNWECGVVLEVPNSKVVTEEKTPQLGVFSATIPVPMIIPGEKYRTDQQPWYYNQEQ